MTTIDDIATLARLIYPRPPRDEARGHDPEVEAEHLTADDGWHVVLLVGLPGDLCRGGARGPTEAVALARAHATLRREVVQAHARAARTAGQLAGHLHRVGPAYLGGDR